MMGVNSFVLLLNVTLDSTAPEKGHCVAALELIRRVPLAEASSTKSSFFGPVVMLCVVIVVKFLPRYVLQKTGQINRESFTKRTPHQLSKAQRDHLLKRQEDLIAKMKAHDRENKEK
ncbi:hypothetical protein STCU_06429 [Strigomonas culicis]|nr:hypothetical protein STCU_06429 [Strigomonas culicis]|eukprot:EPY25883.1 hypothetical protein STCU_06429 [Strigomonas culicis]